MPDAPLDTAYLASLPTETRNPHSANLDQLPTLALLELINDEDATVAAAVRAALPAVAQVVDEVAARFLRGGRLFLCGAGTSGRLGVLDASECPPTFSVPPGLLSGPHRRRRRGPAHSRPRHSEDSPEAGAAISPPHPRLTANDTVVGIAASGRTPWVLGALAHATERGALTVALTCAGGAATPSRLAQAADIAIDPAHRPRGPHRLHPAQSRHRHQARPQHASPPPSWSAPERSYGNLMVNVQPTNAKLVNRAERIIAAATGCTPGRAAQLFREAGDAKIAILMELSGLPFAAANSRLKRANGILRKALQS